MRSMKLVGLAAVAVIALFAVAASSASARTGPKFVGCKNVGAGNGTFEDSACQKAGGSKEWETFNITGPEAIKVSGGAQKLSATGIKIECSGLSAENATIEDTGGLGLDAETLVYTGCKSENVVGTSENCEARTESGTVAGEIKTDPLKSELGYQEAAPALATATLFAPKVGTEFVSIELKVESGKTGKCPATNKFQVTGTVAVEAEALKAFNVTDALTAPKPALKHFFPATGADKKPELKVTGGFTATYSGKANISLNGTNAGDAWGLEE